MSFQLHARILERSSERLRVRFWSTNPDSAQVLPSATHDLSSTPLFLALWLREHCAAGDALMDESARIRTEYAAFREAEVASGRSSRAALVIEEELLSWALALRPVIAGLSIHEVANHPVSKRAAAAEFWRWDGVTPPEHLPRFDLDLVLRDPRWLPAKLPSEVHGTTATTLASKHLNAFRVAARSFLASHPGALAACAPHHFRPSGHGLDGAVPVLGDELRRTRLGASACEGGLAMADRRTRVAGEAREERAARCEGALGLRRTVSPRALGTR